MSLLTLTIHRSALCSIIYNIAEVDFPENWKNSINEIGERMKAGDETLLMSGLMGLKNILQAFEDKIEEVRQPLN
jgi:hypothetical protein